MHHRPAHWLHEAHGAASSTGPSALRLRANATGSDRTAPGRPRSSRSPDLGDRGRCERGARRGLRLRTRGTAPCGSLGRRPHHSTATHCWKCRPGETGHPPACRCRRRSNLSVRDGHHLERCLPLAFSILPPWSFPEK